HSRACKHRRGYFLLLYKMINATNIPKETISIRMLIISIGASFLLEKSKEGYCTPSLMCSQSIKVNYSTIPLNKLPHKIDKGIVDYILPKTCHCFTYNVPNRDKPSNHMNATVTMTNPYSFNSYK